MEKSSVIASADHDRTVYVQGDRARVRDHKSAESAVPLVQHHSRNRCGR